LPADAIHSEYGEVRHGSFQAVDRIFKEQSGVDALHERLDPPHLGEVEDVGPEGAHTQRVKEIILCASSALISTCTNTSWWTLAGTKQQDEVLTEIHPAPKKRGSN
jgi:hypothetical protein